MVPAEGCTRRHLALRPSSEVDQPCLAVVVLCLGHLFSTTHRRLLKGKVALEWYTFIVLACNSENLVYDACWYSTETENKTVVIKLNEMASIVN